MLIEIDTKGSGCNSYVPAPLLLLECGSATEKQGIAQIFTINNYEN